MKKSLRELIQSTRGRFFKVSFIKRTDGTKRTMLARLGVTKHLRGGGMAYDPAKHDLMTCFDIQKNAYRSIPLDSVFYFQSGKTSWRKA